MSATGRVQTGLQSWEQADFPILCPSCFGNNPALRMMKERFGQECKVCMKPFTVFRWCPGSGCRYRKTEICQACSKLKNVCQSCIFDLEYGLPVGVRDAVLQVKDKVPQQEKNREYFMTLNANRLAKGEIGLIDYKKVDAVSKTVLESFSKRIDVDDLEVNEQIKKRNLPPVCSFYAKGTCTRGEYCPFRHELSTGKPANLKSYRDRYYGQEDPLAEKMLERLPEVAAITLPNMKPADRAIKSLYIHGIKDDNPTEVDIKTFFEAYGEVESVRLTDRTATVEFTTRLSAEDAAEHTISRPLSINGVPVKITWTRTRQPQTTKSTEAPTPTTEASEAKRRPPPPPKSSRTAKFSE